LEVHLLTHPSEKSDRQLSVEDTMTKGHFRVSVANDSGVGVGQSLPILSPRTGSTFIHGFSSLRQGFRVGLVDPVPTLEIESGKTIDTSEAYAVARGDD
jgi:hypothetical protein